MMKDSSGSSLSDWQLWSCANKYIQDYGFDAPILAAQRADALLAKGDMAGARTWIAIMHRINNVIAPSGSRM